jgi:hypothetical protein
MSRRKGTAFETFHAAANLYERYGLKTPAKIFLQAIESGSAFEMRCPVPGRKIFDVILQESPEDSTKVRVRCVVAWMDGGPRFVVTYLPPYFPGEGHATGRERAHAEFLDKKKQRRKNLYRDLRRVNEPEEIEV